MEANGIGECILDPIRQWAGGIMNLGCLLHMFV